jgi:hypothetical protein
LNVVNLTSDQGRLGPPGRQGSEALLRCGESCVGEAVGVGVVVGAGGGEEVLPGLGPAELRAGADG